MADPSRWPRELNAFTASRMQQLEAACRAAGVAFHDDAGVATQLERVLLASDFAFEALLGQPLLLGPDFLAEVRDPRPAPARAGVLEGLEGPALARALRVFRLREALRLVWRDVNGLDDLDAVLAATTALAECCLAAALAAAEAAVAARHGRVRDAAGNPRRMVVFALGKLGGGELNFSSDIDLVLAYPAAGTSDGARPLDAAHWFARAGQALVALLADRDADGYVYRVDLRLRPFGEAGRLALSFAAMEQYFQREGRDWERYAWIKARPVAGDLASGRRFLETLRPFVYRRYLDYGAFEGLRTMKALIDAEVARRDLAGNIKLGPGGIREIEFIVQLVQLIRGGREPSLRARGLPEALAACERLGYLPAASAQRLGRAWRCLRRLENRLQMRADAQTHALPADRFQRERLAWALGHAGWPALADELAVHRAAVAEEFAALMAPAETALPAANACWRDLWRAVAAGADADTAVLGGAGFEPPAAAAAALQSLAASPALRALSARSRERLDQVMPALIAAAAATGRPLDCLERLLRLVLAVVRRSVYLALLAEQPAALARLAGLFATSPMLAERLIAHPLLLDELFDQRSGDAASAPAALRALLARRLQGSSDTEAAIETLQELRQTTTFRVGLGFHAGEIDAVAAARALAGIADVVLETVLQRATVDIVAAHGTLPGLGQGDPGMVVVAYGSLGGEELGFSSDLDLVFLHGGADGAASTGTRSLEPARWFARLAQRVVHLLALQTGAGRLYETDVRLRADGSQGLLVQSLAGWESYQRERAWTWELQALVRARPVAGSPPLRQRFERVRAELLATPREAATVCADARSMRERWRQGRDRSSREWLDLKHGAGALVDIEFLLQVLVLVHAARHPGLLASGNSADLIAAAKRTGLLTATAADALARAHSGLLERALRRTLDARPRRVARDPALTALTGVVQALSRTLLCGGSAGSGDREGERAQRLHQQDAQQHDPEPGHDG